MKSPNRYSPILKRISHLFCVIVGVTFIASGFTKAVDPWGTAIKFEEYFTVYGFDFLQPLSRVLGVWLCGAELMMGCMILFRVRLRLISIFALVSMSIFTIVTLLSATLLPVEDCGCFGDALYLTPWQTVAKNLILLPMIITIWWRYRPDKVLIYKPREVIMATLFCIIAMGFSTYNYLYLPMIDFLPFKVGVDLLAEVESTTADIEYAVVLVYRNIASGDIREFGIEDVEWHDESTWEWVETRTDIVEGRNKSYASDFALSNYSGEDVTVELLSSGGKLNIIGVTHFDRVGERCEQRVEEYIAEANQNGEHTIIVTPLPLNSPTYHLGGQEVECYNIDATTLNSMLRASTGVVELRDGVIISKRSCVSL